MSENMMDIFYTQLEWSLETENKVNHLSMDYTKSLVFLVTVEPGASPGELGENKKPSNSKISFFH